MYWKRVVVLAERGLAVAEFAGEQQEGKVREDNGQEVEHTITKVVFGHSERVAVADTLLAVLVI